MLYEAIYIYIYINFCVASYRISPTFYRRKSLRSLRCPILALQSSSKASKARASSRSSDDPVGFQPQNHPALDPSFGYGWLVPSFSHPGWFIALLIFTNIRIIIYENEMKMMENACMSVCRYVGRTRQVFVCIYLSVCVCVCVCVRGTILNNPDNGVWSLWL